MTFSLDVINILNSTVRTPALWLGMNIATLLYHCSYEMISDFFEKQIEGKMSWEVLENN